MTQHLVIGSENNILDLAKQTDFTPEYFYFEADISKVINLGERYQRASIANYLPDSSMSSDECADEEKQSLQELTNFVQQIMITHKESLVWQRKTCYIKQTQCRYPITFVSRINYALRRIVDGISLQLSW